MKDNLIKNCKQDEHFEKTYFIFKLFNFEQGYLSVNLYRDNEGKVQRNAINIANFQINFEDLNCRPILKQKTSNER